MTVRDAESGAPVRRRPRRRLTAAMWIPGALLLLLLFGLAAIAFFDRGGMIAGSAVTIDALADRSADFYGRTVRVTAEVDRVLGRHAFTLGDPGGQVLVLTARLPEGIVRPIDRRPGDRTVQVAGTVRRFEREALERELGVALGGDAFADWAGRPAIVARSIDLAPASAQGAAAPGQAGAQAAPAASASADGAVSLREVARDPDAFLGRTVDVSGRVTERIGRRGFVLGDAMLVVGATESTAGAGLDEGDSVHVRGTVRRFDRARWDLGSDVPRSALEEWAGRPTLIAASVELAG